ncbi:hypothetical protein HSB1_17760 [Halogranum salarium B-1]|uniref:Uncharacterized protein n=1 Tax=Halogranum salarium B-1 TaxID=1210908 RepID=J3A2S8_9EURY|nr:hypothetical protein HSB1_17760 [Halogranum salarium B-1]
MGVKGASRWRKTADASTAANEVSEEHSDALDSSDSGLSSVRTVETEACTLNQCIPAEYPFVPLFGFKAGAEPVENPHVTSLSRLT